MDFTCSIAWLRIVLFMVMPDIVFKKIVSKKNDICGQISDNKQPDISYIIFELLSISVVSELPLILATITTGFSFVTKKVLALITTAAMIIIIAIRATSIFSENTWFLPGILLKNRFTFVSPPQE